MIEPGTLHNLMLVSGLLLVTALCATAVPALRAMRLDPASSLRQE